jgi:hypothetical protein
MDDVPNTAQGIKELFSNPQVSERLMQLHDARKMIPEKLLKITKAGMEDRGSINLDDDRVKAAFDELRNPVKNEPAKEIEGIAMGMNG